MDFFQELFFTAFVAFIFSLIIAKVISFSVSNSSDEGKSAISSAEEDVVAKEVKLGNELKVGSMKSKKRVKFADDVVVRKVELYQDETRVENLELCFDESVGEIEFDEKCEGEKIVNRLDQYGGQELNEGSEAKISGQVKDTVDEDKGSENVVILSEKNNEGDETGEICGENEGTSVSGGLGVISREKEDGEELECHEVETNRKEGNERGRNDGSIKWDVKEEKVTDQSSDNNEDDDWEGIERTELEKVFAEAVHFVEYGGKEKDYDQLAKLPSDVLMRLYGLHKVAVEGPCHEPQPMALKVAARAKWNAWRSLGSMNQEAAMEQYIAILSDSIPGWTQNKSSDDDIQVSSQLGKPDHSGTQLKFFSEDERRNEELDIGADQLEMDTISKEKDKQGKDSATA